MIPREESEGSRKGQVYLGPGKERIPNRGQKKYRGYTQGNNRMRNMVVQDAPVRKPLAAVHRIVEKGSFSERDAVLAHLGELESSTRCWRTSTSGSRSGLDAVMAHLDEQMPLCARLGAGALVPERGVERARVVARVAHARRERDGGRDALRKSHHAPPTATTPALSRRELLHATIADYSTGGLATASAPATCWLSRHTQHAAMTCAATFPTPFLSTMACTPGNVRPSLINTGALAVQRTTNPSNDRSARSLAIFEPR